MLAASACTPAPVAFSRPDDDADGDGVIASEDCNDFDPRVALVADERCDGVDNDCDGNIDEGPVDGVDYYLDADGDTYGGGEPVRACARPPGHTTQAGDCDDSTGRIRPGVIEDCLDEIDNNCDGFVDDEEEGVERLVFYEDPDLDGYAAEDAPIVLACEDRAGIAAVRGDCEPENNDVHPAASEICNGRDDNCDGLADEEDGALDTMTLRVYYRDADGDGHGDPDITTLACSRPDGFALTDGDCDDENPGASPDETEECGDGIDNDCNGRVDGVTAYVRQTSFPFGTRTEDLTDAFEAASSVSPYRYAPEDRATVLVCAGSYYATFFSRDSLTIRGEGASETTLRGASGSTLISVSLDSSLDELSVSDVTLDTGRRGISCVYSGSFGEPELSVNRAVITNFAGSGTSFSPHEGAGVRAEGCTVRVGDAEIRGNRADLGGGIAVADGSLFASASIIADNVAFDHGAGIYATETAVYLRDGVVLENNSANEHGGGLYLSGSFVSFIGATDARNRVDGNQATLGGGLYCLDASCTLDAFTDVSANVASIGRGIYHRPTNFQHVLRAFAASFANANQTIFNYAEPMTYDPTTLSSEFRCSTLGCL